MPASIRPLAAEPSPAAVSNPVVHAAVLDQTIVGTDADETLTGTAFDDAVYGEGGNDSLSGLGGDDVLVGDGDGDVGRDTLVGGAGHDTLFGEGGHDSLVGGEGEDVMYGGGGGLSRDTLEGGAGNDFLYGEDGWDVLVGGSGDDQILGDPSSLGRNTLEGGGGDDVLTGGGGTDRILGGEGNDYLAGGSGDDARDTLDGGAGDDTLQGDFGASSLLGGAGNDYITNVSSRGFAPATLDGGLGADTMSDYGSGNSTYYIDNLGDVIYDNGGGNDTVVISVDFYDTDSFYGIENIRFAEGVRELPYFIESLDSGSAWDTPGGSATLTLTYSFVVNPDGGEQNFKPYTAAEKALVRDALAQYEAAVDIDFVEVTDGPAAELRFFRDDLTSADSGGFAGYAYYPGLYPQAGDVHISSVIDFSAESETQVLLHEIGHALGLKHPFEDFPTLPADEDNWDNTVMSYTFGPVNQGQVLGMFDLATLHFVYGVQPDARTGGQTYRFADRYIWDGGGTDTFSAADQTRGVAVDLRPGSWIYVGSQSDSVLDAGQGFIGFGTVIERVIGGSGADTLTGNDAANTLDGGIGADQLAGGLGNDTYVVERSTDRIAETSAAAGEVDTVKAGVSWTLGSNLEALILTGSAALSGTGNRAANTITGNDAANALNGGAGADTLIGGLGNDTYSVDDAGDRITETSTLAGEVDRVRATVSWSLGGDQIENLSLVGSAAIDGTGNSLDNTITGNGAANALNGAAGDDTLIGGLGGDTYTVNDAGDVVTETAAVAGDIDTVRAGVSFSLTGTQVENLTLTGAGALNGTGNALVNTLVGNGGANTLNAGAGADTITGGAGADIFVFVSATTSDLITDFRSGTDDLRLNQSALRVGDGDTVVDGARTAAGPGGFATAAELVVFTANIAGDITTNRAAVAIGSATSAYAVGDTRLFVVDNGVDTALYLFTAGNADARVSAAELQLLATLEGTPSIITTDILFGG